MVKSKTETFLDASQQSRMDTERWFIALHAYEGYTDLVVSMERPERAWNVFREHFDAFVIVKDGVVMAEKTTTDEVSHVCWLMRQHVLAEVS